MHRFLSPETPRPRSEVKLSLEESHHLAKVVRLKEGEMIELMDGRGSVARAKVIDASAKACRVEILSVETSAARSRICVCFGVPKSAAFDFIVHRCTELGVQAFQPLLTDYSLRLHSWNETRWRKVIAEVCKQCEEPHFPELREPLPLDAWLSGRTRERELVFCHENEREAGQKLPAGGQGCDLLIGSEGGWAPQETQRLLDYGVVPFGLGKNRLRAETAALVATTLLKQRLGEL